MPFVPNHFGSAQMFLYKPNPFYIRACKPLVWFLKVLAKTWNKITIFPEKKSDEDKEGMPVIGRNHMSTCYAIYWGKSSNGNVW